MTEPSTQPAPTGELWDLVRSHWPPFGWPSPGSLGDALDQGRCIKRGCAWRGWSVLRLYPPQPPPAALALFLLCKIYGLFSEVCVLMIYYTVA